jgi:hypothetical protein
MKHSEKKLLLSVGLAFAILGGGFGWRSYLDREPVVNIPPHPKLPNPNGFDLYVKAAQSIVTANPAVDEINDTQNITDPKIRAQRYSLQRKEAWLRQNAAGFRLFQRAVKTPCLHPKVRSDKDIVKMFGAYAPLREMARRVKIKAKTQELRGDWNGAMQSRIDAVQMGTDIASGGPFIASLVAIAVQAIGRDKQWPVIEKLSVEECRAAIARLEKLYARRLKIADALLEEKYFGQNATLEMMRQPQWRLMKDADEYEQELTLSTRLRALTISRREIMDNYSRYMDAIIANSRLPYLPKKKVPQPNDPFSSRIAGIFDNARFNYARNDAGNALWLVALALRAYKLENAKYPAQLTELTPKYLKDIPADPFGAGEALRYKNRGTEYLLYSIGPDGVDNGGKPIPHPAGASATRRKNLPLVVDDSKGDYVAGKNR